MIQSLPVAHPTGSDDKSLALLIEQLTAKLHAGEPVDPETLIREHPEYGERLARLLPTIQALADLGVSAGAGTAPDASLKVPHEAFGTLGDFRIVREIGRGGMGVVYEAEQISLSRHVALKILPFAATMDQRQLQRFQNEARAAACLHHTNIVPIFFVGCERGVHYYAMQYIEGHDLASVLHQLRAQGGSSGVARRPAETLDAPADQPAVSPPAETRPLAALSTERFTRPTEYFRSVARLGIQAAEALDYAHQQGIIHRDIKPGNLMVDTAGQLWVTDFGLARIQSDVQMTMTGDLIGTLRYMSPEQALAKRVVVDHRTDIYSLGATLYELLTLEPAVPGSDRQELLRQIAFEEPKLPRRLNRAIPAELQTIVLKAMEKNPADRYATAQEVADDLERFLKDEAIHARRPSLWQRGRKFARRHKSAVAAGTLLLLTVLLMGGGTFGWSQWQRSVTEHEAGQFLDQADVFQQQERWPDTLEMLARAEGRLAGSGLTDLEERVRQLRSDVTFVAELEEASLQGAAAGKEDFDDTADKAMEALDYARADQLYAAAFASHRLDLAGLSTEEAAAHIRASPIRRQLLAGLDRWAFVKDTLRTGTGEPLLAVARLADDDPWRNRLRDPQVRKDRAALERLAQEEDVLTQPRSHLAELGAELINVNARAAAERLLRAAQQRHPADFWINFELAECLKKPSTKTDAIRFYQAALAIRPQSAAVYNNLGAELYNAEKKWAEAEAAFRKAIELKPDVAQNHSNLGFALRSQGNLAQAEAAFRKAIQLRPDWAVPYNEIGEMLMRQKKWPEAEAAFRKALALKPDFTNAYNLAEALREQKMLPEAEAFYRQAIGFNNRGPSSALPAYCGLGFALRDRGQEADAIVAFQKAIDVAPRLVGPQPNTSFNLAEQRAFRELVSLLTEAVDPKLRDRKKAVECGMKAVALMPEKAGCWTTLGMAHYRNGNWKAARDALNKAKDVDISNPTPTPSFFTAMVLWKLDEKKEASAWYEKGVKEIVQRKHTNTEYPTWLRYRAEAAALLGIPLPKAGYEEAMRLAKKLRAKGQLDEAIAACQEALRIEPNNVGIHINLGEILRDKNDVEGAMREYQEALRIDPENAKTHTALAKLLADAPDPRIRNPKRALEYAEKGVKYAEKGVKLEPGQAAGSWVTLGQCHYRNGDWPAALAALKDAQKHGPGQGRLWFFLAMTQWQLGDKDAARTSYQNGLRWLQKNQKASSFQEFLRYGAEAAELLGIPIPTQVSRGLPGPKK